MIKTQQRVQEELKIEVESLSALQQKFSSVQAELCKEREGREQERERLVEIEQIVVNLAGKETARVEEMTTATEQLRAMETQERHERATLHAQLVEAKEHVAFLESAESAEREKRRALEDELKLASASILRLERDLAEVRARGQKMEDVAQEKADLLEGKLKMEQDAVKVLEADLEAEKEKTAEIVARGQEKASEITKELAAARECVLQSERRERETVTNLEVMKTLLWAIPYVGKDADRQANARAQTITSMRTCAAYAPNRKWRSPLSFHRPSDKMKHATHRAVKIYRSRTRTDISHTLGHVCFCVQPMQEELERSMSRWGKRIRILEEQVREEQQRRRILEESLDRKRVC